MNGIKGAADLVKRFNYLIKDLQLNCQYLLTNTIEYDIIYSKRQDKNIIQNERIDFMKMTVKDLIEYVYTDCCIIIEKGIEETDGIYYVQRIWRGTAADLPKRYYDNEIAIVTPQKYGEIKILLR